MSSPSSPAFIDNDTELATWVARLRRQLAARRHRAALVLWGDHHWCAERALAVLACFGDEPVLCLSDRIAQAVPVKKATTRLGMEYRAVLFDARDDFSPDAFGAISGTLCGGGLMLVLTGRHSDGTAPQSRFMRRALPILRDHPAVYPLRQGQPLPALAQQAPAAQADDRVEAPFRTGEQRQVVEAIEQAALQGMTAPRLLISDRGRGKSSALGLVAGRLMARGVRRILVTAPRLSTADPLFRHAATQLPEAVSARGRLDHGDARLQFMAPDALLAASPDADLLLVDEAAALPLGLLQDLLDRYPASVFATTVHGYEGTGRGFALKFRRLLDARAPGWQAYNMYTPIRWAAEDPLERWVDRLLCLDAEAQDVAEIGPVDPDSCQVRRIDRDALVDADDRLSALFALLVSAHYRTRPSDLKYLLDEPAVRLYTLEYRDRVLGALLVNREGGFDAPLAQAIYRGERRPAGHLLAQTLSFHGGCEAAARLHYARIMRIAVHPALQGQGLGTRLLEQVVEREAAESLDAIGTSFGATPELIDFWRRCGFQAVRMGFTRDHASGTHAAVMLRPLSEAGEQAFDAVRRRFRRHLPGWLQGPLADLSDAMKHRLEDEIVIDDGPLSEDDWQDVRAFAYSHRGLESCAWPLRKLLRASPAALDSLPGDQRRAIRLRLEAGRPWPEVVAASGVTGRAQAIALLRRAVARLIEALQP